MTTGVNNRNVSGSVELPDGSGTLVFDIKGNGSNIKVWYVVPAIPPEPPVVEDPVNDEPVNENPVNYDPSYNDPEEIIDDDD